MLPAWLVGEKLRGDDRVSFWLKSSLKMAFIPIRGNLLIVYLSLLHGSAVIALYTVVSFLSRRRHFTFVTHSWTCSLTKQLSRWDFKSDISHVRLVKLQSKAFSAGFSIEEPINVLLVVTKADMTAECCPKNHRGWQGEIQEAGCYAKGSFIGCNFT